MTKTCAVAGPLTSIAGLAALMVARLIAKIVGRDSNANSVSIIDHDGAAKIPVRFRLAFMAILVALCVCPLAMGQVQTGEILGVVTDATGAAIQGADVTVTDTDTGVVRKLRSDDQGRFDASDLNIGNYEVRAQKQGFAVQTQKGFKLAVGQRLVANFTLTVGSVATQIEVSVAEGPQVNTTTSEVGALVNQEQMADLPLNGRNYEQLFTLVPGVQQITAVTSAGNTNLGSTMKFTAAGTRTVGGVILLDGVEVRSFWGQGGGSQILSTSLGIDGIAEFNTVTSSFSAQYRGLFVMNEVTKSGTNSVHGSGYGFFRNSSMNARNYFDPLTGPPPADYNQFGGSVGGPIKRDRLFYFVNYEGLQDTLTGYSNEQVPDNNAQHGYIPCTLAPDYACTSVNGVNLANVGVSPVTAPYLALYPNFTSGAVGPITGLPAGYTQQVGQGTVTRVITGSIPQHENFVAAKVDYQVSAKDNISFRWVQDMAFQSLPWLSSGSVPLPGVQETDPEDNRYMTLQQRLVLSSNVVNVASFNVALENYGDVDTYGGSGGTTLKTLFNFIAGRAPGALSVTGVSGLPAESGMNPYRYHLNTFTPQDEVDWVHGPHTFKFGMGVTRLQCNCGINQGPGGAYSFGTSAVSGIAPYSGLESFLTNKPVKFQAAVPGLDQFERFARQTTLSPFFQDDWKVAKRLTLNLGVRYDFTTNPVDAGNNIWRAPCIPCGDALVHESQMFATNPSTKNIDPRVGLAWDMFGNQKTSLRAGYGLFHQTLQPRDYLVGMTFSYPNALGAQTNPALTFPNPLVGGWGSPSVQTNNTNSPWNQSVVPYFAEYNLQIQRQLPSGWLVTVSYVGSKGTHLVVNQNVNNTQPTSISNGVQYRATTGNPAPNPNFKGMMNIVPQGSSHYNGLSVQVERRMRSLTIQSAFTWSRCIDWGSSAYSGGPGWDVGNDAQAYLLPALPAAINKGPCSFDVNKNWTTNLIYPLPFHANQLVGGWQFGVIGAAKTGEATTPYSSYDSWNLNTAYEFGVSEYPNRNPTFMGPLLEKKKQPGQVQWFNPTAYVLPPIGYTGASGLRNSIPGPNIVDLDTAVMKDTRIPKFGESAVLELRADIFNVFNHSNFQLPNGAVIINAAGGYSGTAGVITSTTTPSRQMQMSARFSF